MSWFSKLSSTDDVVRAQDSAPLSFVFRMPITVNCPRCPIVLSLLDEGPGAWEKALDEHYATACPTMYQERMLTAFLDRLEGILSGYKP